ncbi:MAG: hypothetical protein M1817_005261 [Caeruleum heppii]|nr:MAG: hypothetical protein M1817_005261 [Caeruleum heppii]
MLHEILLSLSGHPSPLLQPSNDSTKASSEAFEYLSPPEASLISSVVHLGRVHQKLRVETNTISSAHPSPICRAVSTSLVSEHLAAFQRLILEVERDILSKDAGSVGAYEIVPLSWVVGKFEAWIRRMNWFWDLLQFMQGSDGPVTTESNSVPSTSTHTPCTGAALIDRLRYGMQTGYPDIEEAAVSLTRVAETAWLRQLSAWILYGRLPAFGGQDFMIQSDGDPTSGDASRLPEYLVRTDLMPSIVTKSTAFSILFVGRSLNHIRAIADKLPKNEASSRTSPELALLPSHLHHLSTLSAPISSTALSGAIAAIRLSLSKNALQQLLPLPKVLEILRILYNFFLLAHGEFAITLVYEADERIRRRGQNTSRADKKKDPKNVTSGLVKEGEVTAVLTRTWAALTSSQPQEEEMDDDFELARQLVELKLSAPSSRPETILNSALGDLKQLPSLADTHFDDLLLSVPTSLTIQVPSPLDLFLSSKETELYSAIHAYLLSIRRAHLRLTGLWKETSLRRDHPSPMGPPSSNTVEGKRTLKEKRMRAAARSRRMRNVWATAGAAGFLLAEIGEYFEGEVVRGSWHAFRRWVDTTTTSAAPAGTVFIDAAAEEEGHNSPGSREAWIGSSSLSFGNKRQSQDDGASARSRTPHDPETISSAHAVYISALSEELLLTDRNFTDALRTLLLHIEFLVGLVANLASTWKSLDLETDNGVVDTFTDYRQEERTISRDLRSAVSHIQDDIHTVVRMLTRVDRGGAVMSMRSSATDVMEGGFVPWKGSGVDRLLMKLDFGNLMGVEVSQAASPGDGEAP